MNTQQEKLRFSHIEKFISDENLNQNTSNKIKELLGKHNFKSPEADIRDFITLFIDNTTTFTDKYRKKGESTFKHHLNALLHLINLKGMQQYITQTQKTFIIQTVQKLKDNQQNNNHSKNYNTTIQKITYDKSYKTHDEQSHHDNKNKLHENTYDNNQQHNYENDQNDENYENDEDDEPYDYKDEDDEITDDEITDDEQDSIKNTQHITPINTSLNISTLPNQKLPYNKNKNKNKNIQIYKNINRKLSCFLHHNDPTIKSIIMIVQDEINQLLD